MLLTDQEYLCKILAMVQKCFQSKWLLFKDCIHISIGKEQNKIIVSLCKMAD